MLKGLVLCGGESSRMGTDKGLLSVNGNTWAQLTAEKLRKLKIPVLISVHSSQQDAYSTIFNPDDLIVDALPLRGPLAGLLIATSSQPQTDWLLCACDMPDMTMDVLLQLQTAYLNFPDYECFVFGDGSEVEPLCGIYTAKALQKILAMHATDNLPRHSMKFVLQTCHSHVIHTGDSQIWKAFKNYNLPGDIPLSSK